MQRRLLLQQQRQGEVMTQSALWHIEGAAARVLLQEEPHCRRPVMLDDNYSYRLT